MAIPVEHGDHIPCLHSLGGERVSQLMHPRLKATIVMTTLIAVNDVIVTRHANTRFQQLFDQ